MIRQLELSLVAKLSIFVIKTLNCRFGTQYYEKTNTLKRQDKNRLNQSQGHIIGDQFVQLLFMISQLVTLLRISPSGLRRQRVMRMIK